MARQVPTRELLVVLAAVVVAVFLALFLTIRGQLGFGTLVPGIVVAAGSAASLGLSVVAAVAGWLLDDRLPAVAPHQAGAALSAGAVAVLAAAAVYGPGALVVGLAGLAVVSFWWVLPLTVGSLLADAVGAPFRDVLAGWPPSVAAGLVVMFGPGGARYSLLSDTVSRELQAAGLLAVGAVVVFGPGTIAVVADRWRVRETAERPFDRR